MDAPRQPDGPPIRDGKPYSRIAHLAEDMVRPFVAIGARAARRRPERARDPGRATSTRGCCWSRTSATASSAREIAAGASQAELWRAAVDALIALRGVPVPPRLPLPDGTGYTLPRRDRGAFEIEIELLLDWYWPALKGEPAPAERARRVPRAVGARARPPAGAARRLVPARLPLAQPDLAAGARRASPGSASSISRMRSTSTPPSTSCRCCRMRASIVPEALEAELFAHYCARGRKRASRPSIAAAFAAAYADFGAQRNTRLLGLWARLLQAGRQAAVSAAYSAHLGISRAQPARAGTCAPLAAWYDRHFPPDVRTARPCRGEAEAGIAGMAGTLEYGDGAERRPRHAHGAGRQRRCPSRWCRCTARR